MKVIWGFFAKRNQHLHTHTLIYTKYKKAGRGEAQDTFCVVDKDDVDVGEVNHDKHTQNSNKGCGAAVRWRISFVSRLLAKKKISTLFSELNDKHADDGYFNTKTEEEI